MHGMFYELPALPYSQNYLAPIMSEEQLAIHHDKHHAAYIKNANDLLATIDEMSNSINLDYGSIYRKLSFNVGGDILHSLFWGNLTSPNSSNILEESIVQSIKQNFGSYEKFQEIFSSVATTIEGSGWASLLYCPLTQRLLIAQIGNHNMNLFPSYQILLVLDMWEHAYYIDYKNDKIKYVNNFWQIVNWKMVEARYQKAIMGVVFGAPR